MDSTLHEEAGRRPIGRMIWFIRFPINPKANFESKK